jgi:PIN domain nuclease of toxin-antitoxin system
MHDAVTDTHALIWYLGNDPRLGTQANQVFEACGRGELQIYVPTICLVEIVYLQEKGRVQSTLLSQFQAVMQRGVRGLVLMHLTEEIAAAVLQVPRNEVPDMPDRIIAATGLHLGLPVISRDRKIATSVVTTLW